jgi:hypothetical protein
LRGNTPCGPKRTRRFRANSRPGARRRRGEMTGTPSAGSSSHGCDETRRGRRGGPPSCVVVLPSGVAVKSCWDRNKPFVFLLPSSTRAWLISHVGVAGPPPARKSCGNAFIFSFSFCLSFRISCCCPVCLFFSGFHTVPAWKFDWNLILFRIYNIISKCYHHELQADGTKKE